MTILKSDMLQRLIARRRENKLKQLELESQAAVCIYSIVTGLLLVFISIVIDVGLPSYPFPDLYLASFSLLGLLMAFGGWFFRRQAIKQKNELALKYDHMDTQCEKIRNEIAITAYNRYTRKDVKSEKSTPAKPLNYKTQIKGRNRRDDARDDITRNNVIHSSNDHYVPSYSSPSSGSCSSSSSSSSSSCSGSSCGGGGGCD